jgi:hypothetical protein
MRKNNLPTKYVSKTNSTIDVDCVVSDFCRVLENRAPQLGASFRGFLCLRRELQIALAQYVVAEFDYLNRESTTFEREAANEVFRIVLIGTGGASYYLAIRNCVHSMASAMARDALAADVDAAIGGENNAD